tara:strand:- start:104 stop:424 length:321 start_codon:yes stop_codon:yes gene_type:complete
MPPYDRIIHDGENKGIYSGINFVFGLKQRDPDLMGHAFDETKDNLFVTSAYLPKHRVLVSYEGKARGPSKITLSGLEEDVEKFAESLDTENKGFLEELARFESNKN